MQQRITLRRIMRSSAEERINKMNKRITAAAVGMGFVCFLAAGCGEQVDDSPKEIFTQAISQSVTSQTSKTENETYRFEPKELIATTPAVTTTTAQTTETTCVTTQTSAAQTKETTAAKTTAKTTSKTATQQKPKEQPQTPSVNRITGSSPNVELYKSKLFVMGDSVASGYAAYGRVPVDHSVAKVNVSIRSANYQIALAKAANPTLILTSMGMNDWGISTDLFVKTYNTFLKNLRAACPNAVIVVGAITPTAAVNQYPHVSSAVVKSHNAALKHLAETMGDGKIVFFDAYSVVVGNDGVYMQAKYAAGDGLHLQPSAYDALLSAMAVVLDSKGFNSVV